MTATTVRVAGVTFAPNYPESFHLLRIAMIEAAADAEGLAVVLKREPSNPHDINAIEVHVPALGHRVGHIPRHIALKWAPRLDARETPRAWVSWVPVDPGNEHRPGIDIVVDWGTP